MEIQDFKEAMKIFKDSNKTSFCAVHDAHDASLVESIFKNGLCVSHNPYGGKIRHYRDEKGNINLEHCFMATFYELGAEDQYIGAMPVAPIFLYIPEELLEIMRENNPEGLPDCDLYRLFCGYGFETKEKEPGKSRGAMSPVLSEDEANLRLLPSYLVDGYLNPKDGIYYKNPYAYRNLDEATQNKIKQILKEGKARDLVCHEVYANTSTSVDENVN